MNKMKITGIITATAAGAVFAVMYFGPHVNNVRSAVLLLVAGVVVIIGMLIISASEGEHQLAQNHCGSLENLWNF